MKMDSVKQDKIQLIFPEINQTKVLQMLDYAVKCPGRPMRVKICIKSDTALYSVQQQLKLSGWPFSRIQGLNGGILPWCQHDVTSPACAHFTVTTDVLWMDSMTAARRLHKSWGDFLTLGGSFSTTLSAEQSRTLGKNSLSFSCWNSVIQRTKTQNLLT